MTANRLRPWGLLLLCSCATGGSWRPVPIPAPGDTSALHGKRVRVEARGSEPRILLSPRVVNDTLVGLDADSLRRTGVSIDVRYPVAEIA